MVSTTLQTSILQGELADLALYRALRKRARGAFAKTLDGFIATETRHAAFWRKRFDLDVHTPNLFGRSRNLFIRAAVRVFGAPAGYLLLEAVETHGIKQYLELWDRVKDPTVREDLKTILTEEFQHEDEAATGGERAVHPDLIRNAFLGFNDGSVEILGAVSGLAAALGSPSLVAAAAVTVSVAGAISMAAGAFLATHAEREIEYVQQRKNAFLNQQAIAQTKTSAWKASAIVGTGYLIGAAVPVAPFLFGATHAWWSILLSGALILTVSAILAFLSGMKLLRRMMLNVAIIVAAVLISYGIGTWMESLMG